MILASLAILEAGGAYVPMDPDYPAERLALMRSDAQLSVVLTHTPAVDRAPIAGIVLCIDASGSSVSSG